MLPFLGFCCLRLGVWYRFKGNYFHVIPSLCCLFMWYSWLDNYLWCIKICVVFWCGYVLWDNLYCDIFYCSNTAATTVSSQSVWNSFYCSIQIILLVKKLPSILLNHIKFENINESTPIFGALYNGVKFSGMEAHIMDCFFELFISGNRTFVCGASFQVWMSRLY